MELKERFSDLMSHWTNDALQIELQWKELSAKYTESFRHYHNLAHISELLHYFDTYNSCLSHPNEVEYAIFYHDIIYNVWSKKNELNSAELASEYLNIATAEDFVIKRIFNLIMVTKDHTPKENENEQWMVDFDLAILGQPWERYLAYTKQIRSEYSSVPNLLYRKGRRKVLNHFLDKQKIYHTDTFYDLYEEQARLNLRKEL